MDDRSFSHNRVWIHPLWPFLFGDNQEMSFLKLEFVAQDGKITADTIGTEGEDSIVGTPGPVEVTEEQALEIVRQMFARAKAGDVKAGE